MSASTSLRAFRITEEDPDHRDNEPLLSNSQMSNDLELGHPHHKAHDWLPTAHISVAFIVSLICVFSFILSTVFFGVLYYKISESTSMPDWPKPSNSLLGEYSEAAVAADNNFCSEIGRNILLDGGNAVESAIATLICIGVLDVQSAGLGGGPHDDNLQCNDKEMPCTGRKRDRYEKAQFGWEAVAVPGELHGMWKAYKHFGGNLPWKKLVEPTVHLMDEGHPTSHALAAVLKMIESNITSDPVLKRTFINPETGHIYKPGEQITTMKSLKKTLEILANATDPVEVFYKGELAKQMVKEFKQHGGILTEEDLSEYESILRQDEDVIYVELADGKIKGCGPPPPSGAAVALSILNLLDGFPMDTKTVEGNAQLFHQFIEASKFAYAKRSELGDMKFVQDAMNIARNITSKQWAYETRKLITNFAHSTEFYGGNFTYRNDHGTSHISVIDKHGNAVSVTSTINLYLGAQVMSNSTGIVFNDEMDDFSMPDHPNYFDLPPSPNNFIAPKKRPQSSMSPLIFFSDKTVLSIGGAGGSRIISGTAYAAMHILSLNRTLKEAIDFPRLHNQLRPNYTEAEPTFLAKYLTELEHRGQTFSNSTRTTVLTAVMKFFHEDKVYANSDYRKGSESSPSGF
ncbi:Gamma-glutamyltransferase [Aphelenchoides bicaudatus]|nr:Gamma-glutamyltransferase [Aphelenchoides bicaudatus]